VGVETNAVCNLASVCILAIKDHDGLVLRLLLPMLLMLALCFSRCRLHPNEATRMTKPSMHGHHNHMAKQNAETRDRTGDLQIFGLTLSQLSYRGKWIARFPSYDRITAMQENGMYLPMHARLCLPMHVRHRCCVKQTCKLWGSNPRAVTCSGS
jgi:hypothetical protein